MPGILDGAISTGGNEDRSKSNLLLNSIQCTHGGGFLRQRPHGFYRAQRTAHHAAKYSTIDTSSLPFEGQGAKLLPSPQKPSRFFLTQGPHQGAMRSSSSFSSFCNSEKHSGRTPSCHLPSTSTPFMLPDPIVLPCKTDAIDKNTLTYAAARARSPHRHSDPTAGSSSSSTPTTTTSRSGADAASAAPPPPSDRRLQRRTRY